jgi:hypothetical protein
MNRLARATGMFFASAALVAIGTSSAMAAPVLSGGGHSDCPTDSDGRGMNHGDGAFGGALDGVVSPGSLSNPQAPSGHWSSDDGCGDDSYSDDSRQRHGHGGDD